MAAAQGERDGFYALGVCYHNCEGCDEDLEKSNENMMLAAELGHVYAMAPAGSCFEESDPRRWDYWAVAAAHQAGWNFLSSFSKQVEKFHSGSGGSATAVFSIGHALKGHVNEKERKIFNVDSEFEILGSVRSLSGINSCYPILKDTQLFKKKNWLFSNFHLSCLNRLSDSHLQ